MPKPTKIPGLNDYGDDAPKQTVFPKAQSDQAPLTTPGRETKIPGLKDYGASQLDDSLSVKSDPRDSSKNGLLYDIFHPQPANLSRPQTWHDWLTRTYEPAASDVGRAALDDVSFGFADPIRARLTGENLANLRAQTADAQAAMGPAGPLVNALTYAIPGGIVGKGLEAAELGGKVAAKVGRYGVGAIEGGTANATSSVGHQIDDHVSPLKVGEDAATGAVFGVGGQTIGDLAAGAARRLSNYVRGSPGRGGEQWNWRDRATAGDPTLPDEIARTQQTFPPDDPAQPALARTQGALAQSTEPGSMANAIYAGTGALGGAWGAPPELQLLGGIGGLTAGGIVKQMFGTPGARAINTLDRNINVGQSLDQLYPALYGRQTPAPALDTSGWADALRRLTIGSERPGPPGSQVW